MKYKIILFTFFAFFAASLWAQTTQTSSHNLIWKGVVKWYVDSLSINVISFDEARYPSENHLPYFNQRIACDQAFSYDAELKNPVYIPLTDQENAIVAGNSIPAIPEVLTSMLYERGVTYADVRVFPFINREGKVLKLQSFDLQVNKNTKAQKMSASTIHTYASESVLAQGKFVKIRITDSGVYKLTYDDLTSMGIDPANVRIFGYGGGVLEQSFQQSKIDDLSETAIYMEKGSDGVFNSGDYILFYAQGINRWSYDKTKLMFTHVINPYSKYGYYFVTSDAGTGKKIEEKATVLPQSPAIIPVNEFVDYQVYEKDLISLVSSGKEFYGETFSDITSIDLPFSFPNPVFTNTTTVRMDVAANSSAASSFTLSLNGEGTKTINVPAKSTDHYTQAIGTTETFSFTPQTSALTFNLTYAKSTSTSIGYLNYLEVNVRRQLKMNGSVMRFQNVDFYGTNTYSQFQLSNASANAQIWDITDPQNISKKVTQIADGKVTFVGSNIDVLHYIAIDPTASSAFPKPEIVGAIPNQNLHALPPVDMVIITHPNFLSQAETLAQAHREKDGLTVAVVTIDQVYNEFSSGAPDATAYRWLMKMLYDRALSENNTSDMPKYLLLFGRGSFDNRKILSNSGDNLILTYQAENSLVTTLSYVTDDYFGLLDDYEGTNVPGDLLDIGIGRFPVSTTDQATDVVNKTIRYMNNEGKGNWKNQLCFLADDGDNAQHMDQADGIAVSIGQLYPAFQVNKIYLDAYQQEVTASGESYPLAKSRFQNLLRSGLFLLDYTGHAGASGWGNEGILSIADVKSLSNQHLPIFVGATCDFLQFDVQTVSAGEQVVLNPLGGGIGILSAARPVYAYQNFTLNKLFCDNLFKKENSVHKRVGDVLAYAKNNVGSEINKLSYIYMGDPAVRLNYPTKYNIVTSKVNESTTFGNDTLRALSVDTIQGFIADENGNKVTDFNGTLHAVVYDKIQSVKTQDNHQDFLRMDDEKTLEENMAKWDSLKFRYNDRANILFSGKTEVINGVYSFSFMLPKDIKYNYGAGRISYYAEDDTNDYEAQGYFENFLVGGTDTSYVDESNGPAIKIYMNPSNSSNLENETVFVSGSKVNETPLFVASVSDINGINTVGSGIGHDVMLTVDEDMNQSYILNDYFQAATNSYTDGVVQYKLPQMTNGKHTLTFRVWDLLNNSSTNSIDFEVVKGLTPVVYYVSCYPNPIKIQTNNEVTIVVKHDRPETILNTIVDVFDLSGRKIWSFSQSSADNITWDLTANGQKIKTGLYLYRVSIKTADSDISSKTNKMMIIEQ